MNPLKFQPIRLKFPHSPKVSLGSPKESLVSPKVFDESPKVPAKSPKSSPDSPKMPHNIKGHLKIYFEIALPKNFSYNKIEYSITWEGFIINSKRQPPIDLLAHKRLLVRLRNDHEKYQFISDKVYQLSAGYAGEVSVDQIFPEIGLPAVHTIFKDLRLEVLPNFYIQLDTLIITQNSIILLEIKNYSGTIYFDEQAGKTIRIASNGDVDKFDCAVHQVDRAVHGLREILHNFPGLSIHPILVMANRRTEIAQYPETTPVKYKKQLPKYMRQLFTQEEAIDRHTLNKVIKQIQKHIVQRQQTPLCERYEIPATDLQQGVLCLACHQQMAKSQGRSWTCEVCQVTNPAAVEQSVNDWFTLFQPTLSNKQLRQFLEINSKSATYVLSELTLRKKGKGRRTYYVPRQRRLRIED